MEKFTKGPWKIHAINDYQVVGGLIKPTDNNYDSYHPGIVNLGKQSNGTYISMPDEERVANALLIAAAPDLYEALTGLLNFCESHNMDNHWTEAARAALAKATTI